jgi:predicted MFS family arabinose efflux permease
MLAFLALIPLTEFYQAIVGLTLIAFSYSCLYLGSTKYLIENNSEKGQAAGLLNSAISLASVVGSIVGGIVMQYYGFQAVMAVGAFFSFLGYMAVKIKPA